MELVLLDFGPKLFILGPFIYLDIFCLNLVPLFINIGAFKRSVPF